MSQLQPTTELRLLSPALHMNHRGSRPFSPTQAFGWLKPHLTSPLQPHEEPWARSIQLSHLWMPDPYTPWDTKCLLFSPQNVEAICHPVAEHWRIDAFELQCWKRLLRVPWTAKRSNPSSLKDINPEYSLEGLMLKLQYFGHLYKEPTDWKRHWNWERLRQKEKRVVEDEMVR